MNAHEMRRGFKILIVIFVVINIRILRSIKCCVYFFINVSPRSFLKCMNYKYITV